MRIEFGLAALLALAPAAATASTYNFIPAVGGPSLAVLELSDPAPFYRTSVLSLAFTLAGAGAFGFSPGILAVTFEGGNDEPFTNTIVAGELTAYGTLSFIVSEDQNLIGGAANDTLELLFAINGGGNDSIFLRVDGFGAGSSTVYETGSWVSADAQVPVPAPAALLLGALAGIGALRRRG